MTDFGQNSCKEADMENQEKWIGEILQTKEAPVT